MNKQQLANKIWQSANKMRSKIEAHEYKDYILGFIFYKFLSDKEVAFLCLDIRTFILHRLIILTQLHSQRSEGKGISLPGEGAHRNRQRQKYEK